MTLTLEAPAKINWTLSVLRRRDDGYHDILSLMQRISLSDVMIFQPSRTFHLESDMALPAEDNLVCRAARVLQEYTGCREGARIVLRKEIPAGAGLGGGSSDAATTLRGLNALWGLSLPDPELMALGASLGSDVPFFMAGPLAIAAGRGEKLEPLPSTVSYDLLIVKPALSVSTAEAYRKLNRGPAALTNKRDEYHNINLLYRYIESRDRSRLASLLHNDFEETVFDDHPVAGDLKKRLLDAGAAAALMSGSGSALFGLFDSSEGAGRAAGRFPDCWSRVVKTLTDRSL